ncbi:MAG: M1 family metallopeptidase, partial [Bacteroidota bacterium]
MIFFVRILAIKALLLGLSFGLHAQSSAGELPLSPEVAAAREAGTRSQNGEPGPKYWQNRAAYQIEASLDPSLRRVKAKGSFTYYNQSPDELQRVVLRLHQNIYRHRFDRDDRLAESELTDGIIFSSLILNGDTLDLMEDPRFEEDETLMYLYPDQALVTGASLTLEAEWEFTITAGGTIRQGTYGDPSFFVGYWYPQFSVYDDLRGWDTLQYRGLHEFYQDFADFDVKITAPDSLVVWATGELQNLDEVLTPTYASRLKQAMKSDKVIKVVSKEDYERGTAITTPGEGNTWHYVAQGVPDFAFASSDYYYWDATSALIEDGSRRVLVDAVYQPAARDFYSVAKYSKDIIEYLSDEMPGIPYPYPAMTVFNGDLRGFGGGMEFPMMCNDGSSFAEAYAFSLTHHEIAHTYFPFMTGINERYYAWMEEGWASYLPTPLMGIKGYSKEPMYADVASYQSFAGNSRELPLMTPSHTVSGQGYWIHAYQKPAVAYHLLRGLMGEEAFKEALRTYIRRWESKHPTPFDFFATMEDVSGQELDWFFKPWFFETGVPDLAIQVNKVKRKKMDIQIQRKGSYPVPV